MIDIMQLLFMIDIYIYLSFALEFLILSILPVNFGSKVFKENQRYLAENEPFYSQSLNLHYFLLLLTKLPEKNLVLHPPTHTHTHSSTL